MAKIRLKNPGKPLAWLIRATCGTLRFRVVDHAGLDGSSMDQRTWIFWHNRMFIFPWLHQALFPGRRGAVLTSASGDGQIIADVCSEFGFRAVRGSSSRRGAQALMALADCIRAGEDIGITPDGPRGPRFRMNMGVIKLAQLTGGKLMPVHVRYDRALRLPTWDGFQIPLPFSGVEVEIASPFTLPRRMTEEECESRRAELERAMIAGAGEG